MSAPWATPGQVREVAARIDNLVRRLDDVEQARRGDGDDARRLAGFRLDDVLGSLRQQCGALLATADDLARLAARPADACAMRSGVCPEHGNTLAVSGDRSWCTRVGCGRRWNYPRLVEPCTEPVIHHLHDPDGDGLDICAGHALDALRRLVGARLPGWASWRSTATGCRVRPEARTSDRVTGLIEKEQRVTARRDEALVEDLADAHVRHDGATENGPAADVDEESLAGGSVAPSGSGRQSLAQKIDHLFTTFRPGRREFSIAHVSRATQADGGPGISVATLWALRTGTRDNPTMRNLQALAKFFEVPAQYFFDDAVSERVDEQLALVAGLRDERVVAVTERAAGLTPESLDAVAEVLDRLRRLEGLPAVESPAASANGQAQGREV